MDYINIVNDKKINNIYLEIKNNSNFYMDHAIKHRDNVINYCKQLITIFNIDNNIANNILIAAALHDIGRFKNDKNHAETSALFAKEYLKDKLPINDINFIYNLIINHSGFKERTFYQEILYFADKMDITKDRLEDNYQEKYNISSILEYITKIDFKIKDKTFIVTFITSNNVTIADMAKERKKYDIGIEYNISSLSSMKNLKYEVYWNEEIIFKGHKKTQLI